MIRLARIFMGLATGLMLVLMGFDLMDWRYWVLVVLILIHSIVWSHLDWLEREQRRIALERQRRVTQ